MVGTEGLGVDPENALLINVIPAIVLVDLNWRLFFGPNRGSSPGPPIVLGVRSNATSPVELAPAVDQRVDNFIHSIKRTSTNTFYPLDKLLSTL